MLALSLLPITIFPDCFISRKFLVIGTGNWGDSTSKYLASRSSWWCKKVKKTSALKYFYSVRTDRCRKYNECTKEHSTGDTKDGPEGRFNLTLMWVGLWDPNAGIGEGNGTPLQYSCLENPMDGRAWWAAIHGVDRSRARLSDFTFTFHFHALEREMAPHSVFLPGESQGQRSLEGCRLWGHTESDTTEAT